MHFMSAAKETSSNASPSGLRNVSFEITPSPCHLNDYALAIEGFLTPGWAGRLTAGLAQRQVGIVKGEAEKVNGSSWRAAFKLKSAPFASDPLCIDYGALANTEVPQQRTAARIELRDLVIEPCHRHQGSLYLEIKGVDRLGFLGDLLDYFSMRCLFPVKMTIETAGDTAMDKFWLRGVGGSTPSDSLVLAIRENLEAMIAGSGRAF